MLSKKNPKSSAWSEAALTAALVAGAFAPGCSDQPPAIPAVAHNEAQFRKLADKALDLLELRNVTRTAVYVHQHTDAPKICYRFQFEFDLRSESLDTFIEYNQDSMRAWKAEYREHYAKPGEGAFSNMDAIIALLASHACLPCGLSGGGNGQLSFRLDEPLGETTEEIFNPLPVWHPAKYCKNQQWQPTLRLIDRISGQPGLDALRSVIQWAEPPIVDTPDGRFPVDKQHPDSTVDFNTIRQPRRATEMKPLAHTDAPSWGERIEIADAPRPRGV